MHIFSKELSTVLVLLTELCPLFPLYSLYTLGSDSMTLASITGLWVLILI